MPSTFATRSAHGPLVVATLVYLGWCAIGWHMWMDDAFMSFRYAEHLADGLGPIWNRADAKHPIEGFTSFLHVFALGALRWLTGLRTVDLARPLSILFGLGTLVSLARALSERAVSRAATWLALSPFILPYAALVTLSGMETPLGMFFALNTALFCLRYLEHGTPRALYGFALHGMFTTLTRPEFALAFGLLLSFILYRASSARLRVVLAVLGLYVLPGALTVAWRWHFFGTLVPHPFHRKQAGPLSLSGFTYVLRFTLLVALPFLLPIALRLRELWANHRDLTFVALGVNGLYLAYFATTNPLMGDFYRFLVIQLPILTVLAAVACGIPSASSLGRRPVFSSVALLLATTLAQAPAWLLVSEGGYRAGIADYRRLGALLRPFAGPERWLVYHDVGAIVYESDFNTIDVVGLNTDMKTARLSPCVSKADLVLRAYNTDRGNYLNPCSNEDRQRLGLKPADAPGEARYVEVSDLVRTERNGRPVQFFRLFARHDIGYLEDLRVHLKKGWGAPSREYSLPSGWRRHYLRIFYKS